MSLSSVYPASGPNNSWPIICTRLTPIISPTWAVIAQSMGYNIDVLRSQMSRDDERSSESQCTYFLRKLYNGGCSLASLKTALENNQQALSVLQVTDRSVDTLVMPTMSSAPPAYDQALSMPTYQQTPVPPQPIQVCLAAVAQNGYALQHVKKGPIGFADLNRAKLMEWNSNYGPLISGHWHLMSFCLPNFEFSLPSSLSGASDVAKWNALFKGLIAVNYPLGDMLQFLNSQYQDVAATKLSACL